MTRFCMPLAALLAVAVASPLRAQTAAGPVTVRNGVAQSLNALFAQEWERTQREYPEIATYNGDTRFDDRWTDLAPAAIAARQAEERAALQRLRSIDRAWLSDDQQLNYDTFEWLLERAVERQRFHESLRPVDHKNGPQLDDGIAEMMPFETTSDYRKFLQRMAALPRRIDQVIELMQEGVAQGNTTPRVLLERVPAQIALQIVEDPARSPFYRPFTRFPEAVSAADRAALQAQARLTIRDRLVPAFRKFQMYFNGSYLPRSRTSVAATALPDGQAYYEFLVRLQTTTSMSADEIHRIGLAEVSRLRGQMERLKDEIGFAGSLGEFFVYLRSDPKFFYKTPEELMSAYTVTTRRIDPELGRVFHNVPRQPYGVREIPANAAPDTTTAYYQPGAADGSRPGYYYVNLYKPETRPSWEIVPLTLHEAVPGHHFQFARALEMQDAPMFRRTAYFVAYGEGWALYAEQLGYDMGLYEDPYDRFGQLTYEMWRTVRLVVDTGLHSKGWSREKAIEFFKENTARTDQDIVNEIDRYIGDPAQALAYKIGQMKISELRRRAERALGPRFDLRDFNDAVLAVGSVPLTALETHMTRWIAEQAGR